MNEITSTSNKRIIELTRLHKKKYLEESEFFLVEGKKCYDELVASNISVVEIFITKDKMKIINDIEGDNVTIVSEHVLKKLATTDSTPEIIVLAKKRKYDYSDVTSKNLILLLENIKDAGNLGTIIRSSAAFDCGAILLAGDTIDIYNPKVIRAAAGNFFKIPILKIKNANELKSKFKGHKLIATSLQEEKSINADLIKKDNKNIVMFGSEADGLSSELIKSADYNLKIQHSKEVESLNLSVAASIVLHSIYNKP